MTATDLIKADLAAQLTVDRVAYSAPQLAKDNHLQQLVGAALRESEAIAVVDQPGISAPELRNLAQDLQDATDLDTVIVQAPGLVAAVSTRHSRAALEAAQAAVPAGVDQVTAIQYFHGSLDHAASGTPGVLGWTVFACLLFTIFIVGARSAYRSAINLQA